MVLEMDPHYVIRRYETGKFAINNSIRRIYQEALVLSGQFNSSPKSSQTTETKLIKGTGYTMDSSYTIPNTKYLM